MRMVLKSLCGKDPNKDLTGNQGHSTGSGHLEVPLAIQTPQVTAQSRPVDLDLGPHLGQDHVPDLSLDRNQGQDQSLLIHTKVVLEVPDHGHDIVLEVID